MRIDAQAERAARKQIELMDRELPDSMIYINQNAATEMLDRAGVKRKDEESGEINVRSHRRLCDENAQGRTKWTSRCTTNRRKSSFAFHETDVDEVLYGGAAGGGKSYAICWDALVRCAALSENACLSVQTHVSGAGADADSDDAFHRAQGIGQIHGEHTPDETGQRECAPIFVI